MCWPDGVTTRVHRVDEVLGVVPPSTRLCPRSSSGVTAVGIAAEAVKAKSTTACRRYHCRVRAPFRNMAHPTQECWGVGDGPALLHDQNQYDLYFVILFLTVRTN